MGFIQASLKDFTEPSLEHRGPRGRSLCRGAVVPAALLPVREPPEPSLISLFPRCVPLLGAGLEAVR